MQYSSEHKKAGSDYLISINSCGDLRATHHSHIRREAGRSDYQLIYICGGHCVVTRNQTVEIVYPGDCILYRPGEPQDYLLTAEAQSHTYWIHFNGSLCGTLLAMLSLEKACIIRTEQSKEIEHLMAKIIQHFQLQTPNNGLICSGLLQSVLALLSNEEHKFAHSVGSKNGNRISELIGRMKTVPNLKFTVAECADFCHLSKAHFARIFKQTTGMPPVQFILQLRVERAKELLDYTDQSIADIAEASGFQDQNYFSRSFKKITGMSPSQYRRMKKPE